MLQAGRADEPLLLEQRPHAWTCWREQASCMRARRPVAPLPVTPLPVAPLRAGPEVKLARQESLPVRVI